MEDIAGNEIRNKNSGTQKLILCSSPVLLYAPTPAQKPAHNAFTAVSATIRRKTSAVGILMNLQKQLNLYAAIIFWLLAPEIINL